MSATLQIHQRFSHASLALVLVCLPFLIVGVVAPNPLWYPQLQQRHNLEHGICDQALAISVCLEGSMARTPWEFDRMVRFVIDLVRVLNNVQSRTVMMAINYCSYMKEWIDWTTSTAEFNSYMLRMTWPYHFSSAKAAGTGMYGAYSPLAPKAGTCLDRARFAMAQLPPGYQRLIVLISSGHSSNPLLTIQNAQAAMYDGTEIFGITERINGISEEIRLSVSGSPYLLAVNNLASLGKPELDRVITNVCRIERSAKGTGSSANGAGTASEVPELSPFIHQGNDVTYTTNMAVSDNGLGPGVASELGNGSQATSQNPSTQGVLLFTTLSSAEDEPVATKIPAQASSTEALETLALGSGIAPTTAPAFRNTQSVSSSGISNPLQATTELPCIDLSGVRNPFRRLAILRANRPRRACEQPIDSEVIPTASGLESTRSRTRRQAAIMESASNTARPTVASGDDCVDLSNIPEIFRPAAALAFRRPACRESEAQATRPQFLATTAPLAAGTATPKSTTVGVNCIDLSGVLPIFRPIVLAANAPLQACSEITITTSPLTTSTTLSATITPSSASRTTSITTETTPFATLTTNAPCLNLTGVPDFLIPIVIALNQPLQPCTGSGTATGVTATIPARATLTSAETTASEASATNLPCLNLSVVPDALIPIVIAVNQPLQPCSGSNAASTTVPPPAATSAPCLDLSDVPDILKPIVIAANQPLQLCSTSDAVTAPVPPPAATSTPCLDLSGVPDILKPVVIVASLPLQPCSVSGAVTPPLPPPAATSTSCLDLSGVPDILKPVVIAANQPLQPCSASGAVTAPVPPPAATSAPCLDLSDVPDILKPIVIAANQPLQPCLEAIPAPTTSAPCLDLTDVPEPLKPIVIALNPNLQPCSGSGTAIITTTSASCLDLTGVPDILKPIVIAVNLPLQPCPGTDAVTSAPVTAASCVDLSNVPDLFKPFVIAINQPLPPCRDTDSVQSTAANCIDVSNILPVLVPIVLAVNAPLQPCTDTDSGNAPTAALVSPGHTTEIPCLDLSNVLEPLKPVVIALNQPRKPCPETGVDPTTADCVDLSNVLPIFRPIVLAANAPKPACSDVPQTTPSPTSTTTTTPIPTTTQPLTSACSTTVLPGIYLTKVPDDLKPIFLALTQYVQVCEEPAPGSPTPTTLINSAATTTPTTPDCIDLTDVPETLRAVIIRLAAPAEACPDTLPFTNASSPTVEPTRASTKPTCIDMTGILPEIQSVLLMLYYPMEACDLNTTSTVTPDKNTDDCVDLSHIPESNKRLAEAGIAPKKACPSQEGSQGTGNVTEPPNSVAETPEPTALPCFDATRVSPELRPLFAAIIAPRVFCDLETETSTNVQAFTVPTSAQTSSSAALTISPTPATTERGTTAISVGQTDPPCLDISTYPEILRPVVLRLFSGRKPCNNDTAGNVTSQSDGSVSSGSSVTLRTDKPRTSNEPLTPFTTPKSGIVNTTPAHCIDLTLFPENQRVSAMAFFRLYQMYPCPLEGSSETQNSTASPCVDVSFFSPQERISAVAFLAIYGIVPCPDATASPTTSITRVMPSLSPGTTSLSPCFNISAFPEDQRASIIVFFEQQGLTPCSDDILSTSPEKEPSTAASCVDVSAFPEDERSQAIVTLLLQGLKPCLDANGTDKSDSSVPCIDLSIFPKDQHASITVFFALHDIVPCSDTSLTNTSTSPPTSTKEGSTSVLPGTTSVSPGTTPVSLETTSLSPCVNISAFPVSQRASTIAFLEQNGIRPCPDETRSTSLENVLSTTASCVDVSVFPENERSQIIVTLLLQGLKPCVDANGTDQSDSSLPCIDLSIFPKDQHSSITAFFSLHGLVPCPITTLESLAVTSTSPTASTTEIPTSVTPCFNLMAFPEDQRASIAAFFEQNGMRPCSNETTSTLPEKILSTTQTAASCVDVSGYPENERAQAIVALLLQGLTPCLKANETDQSDSSLPCIDLSIFPIEQHASITAFFLLRGLVPCSLTTLESPGVTSAFPTVSTTEQPTSASPCYNLRVFPEDQRASIAAFFEQNGIGPCSDKTTSTLPEKVLSTTQPAGSCVDVSGFPENERSQVIVTLFLQGLKPCLDANGTGQSDSSLPCIDLSIFPQDQHGSISAFFSLHGLVPCFVTTLESLTKTTSSPDASMIKVSPFIPSGTSVSPCVDVSAFPEDQRASTFAFFELQGLRPCPDEISSSSQEKTPTTAASCVEISVFPEKERPGAIAFLALYGIKPCPDSLTADKSRTSVPCVDLSIFPTEQQESITAFFSLHGIVPCSLTTVASSISPTPSTTNNSTSVSPCYNVRAFPEDQIASIAAFFEQYGMRPCSDETLSTSPAKAFTVATSCVDVSVFPENERSQVIVNLLFQGFKPCLGANGTDQSDSSLPCIDLSIFPEDQHDSITAFFSLHGLVPCSVTTPESLAKTPTSPTASTKEVSSSVPPGASDSSCVDISVFPENQRASTIAFLEQQGLRPCSNDIPSPSPEKISSAAVACVDVSVFPKNERPGAIAFLSLYRIKPCLDSIRTDQNRSSTSCIDLNIFPEVQRISIAAFFSLHGLVPCSPSTLTSTAVSFTTSMKEGTTSLSPCVNISAFPEDQRASTIALFEQNGIRPCPEDTGPPSSPENNMPSTATSCVDISVFPENERAGAIALLSLNGIKPCLDTLVTDQGNASSPCINLSLVTEDQHASLIEFLKPLKPCPLGISSVPSPTTVRATPVPAGTVASSKSPDTTKSLLPSAAAG